MANKKYLDLDGLAYYKSKEDLALANKVDKETGKGLSSNDYTSTEKSKLANIESGAQANVLEGVQVNGVSVTPTNKIANIQVPTDTSDLTNNAGFITGVSSSDVVTALGYTPEDNANKVTTIGSTPNDTQYPSALAVKGYVDSAIGGITGIEFVIVQSLPATGESGKIYLVSNGGSGTNIYDEYVWLTATSTFEKIGTTDIDLSDYQKASELIAITTNEVDNLFE